MRVLGVRSGWAFFEHAGSAVAVDLQSGDVTDVFSADTLSGEWSEASPSADMRRAEILARSSLATSMDTSKTFRVPSAVRASAAQALEWQTLYGKSSLIASIQPKQAAQFLSPPEEVRSAALSAVGSITFSETDRLRVVQLGRNEAVPVSLVERMHLFFSRHDKKSTPSNVWNSWGGDAGKEWASRVMSTRQRSTSDLTEALATSETIDYDTLKLLPRAFSVISSPHELSCAGSGRCSCGGSPDSGTYPSERAVTFTALGGDTARRWADEIVRREEVSALLAAGYDPDADVLPEDTELDQNVFDATKPHQFAPIPTYPAACVYCLKDEIAEVHDDAAVDYSIADINPGDAHYFVQSVNGEDVCSVCGEAVDGALHKQAALAAYYANKADWDKRYAETRKYWEGQEQGLSAAASVFGVDWIEDDLDQEEFDLFERSALIEEEMEDLAWQRRDDLYDPMAYYGAFSGDDPMTIDQVYVSDGPILYRYDPYAREWEQAGLDTDAQIFELDDESAHMAIRALSLYPGSPVDLREMNPGEAFLMEQCLPALEQEMFDRSVVVTASAASFAAEYTPEERAENAKKQVRDRSGRFARSGGRVSAPKGPGKIGKIDKETQSVEVEYDNGEKEWTPAKDIDVLPEQPKTDNTNPVNPKKLTKLIKKIPAKPRATANTPKALLKRQLQPMDANGIKKVLDNYEAMIAEDRKKAKKIRKRNQAVTAAGTPTESPETSDVAPMYLAVVDEADHQAVLDLLALTPADSESTESVVWRRTEDGWERDDSMMRKLKSSAPPPIVKLEQEDVADVLAQVDTFYDSPEGAQAEADADQAPVAAAAFGPYGELLPVISSGDPASDAFANTVAGLAELTAAGIPGIADTPSDAANVARLKRYWTIGEGGAKIRWNTPGDMTRCMRQLRKYMPLKNMHAGYCAKLHHAMTGTWPGDKRNIGVRGSGLFETKILRSDDVIRYSALVAAAQVSLDGSPIPTEADQVPTDISGAPFRIPILAPVGVRSGDGRKFSPLALSTRELPLPLMWQVQTQEGHDASVIVGRIDSIERAEDGSLVEARGVFDVGPYGKEAERLVRHKFLRGVSVDLDEFEAESRPAMPEEDDDATEMGVVKIRPDEMTITNGRVMGATLVAKPAFQEVTIELAELQEEVIDMADGTYIGTPDSDEETEAMVASALVAAGIPLNPPVEWFDDPKLTERTPLTINDDGRVFGHIATWDVEHIGLPFSTTPPKSRSNYAYFHTGVLRTAEGVDVPVGQITLAGGHADLNASAEMAVKHYDDTASAMCDVHAGEDQFGIWVAGALRPSVTGEQIRAMRAAAPSGDWRPINGRLEMVAVCQVNVPGFPTVRARVASGHVYSLVAAGTATLNKIRATQESSPLDQLLSRIEQLEAPQREALDRAREAAVARVESVRQARAAKARERFSSLRSKRPEATKTISPDQLQAMVQDGRALPNGQFAISTVGDLRLALLQFGSVDSSDRTKVRRHIQRRAFALGKQDLIPASWREAPAMAEDVADALIDTMFSVTASGRYPDGRPWDPANHPRDEHGRFREVIAKIRSDLESEAGTAEALEKLDLAERAEDRGDTDAAQEAAKDVLDQIDKLGDNTMDEAKVEKLRSGYENLSEAIANLPLQMGDLNEKFRFSDLPDDLKSLIQDLVSRADKRLEGENREDAIGKLEEFISGGDVLSQPDISAELARVVRYLI